ncbi:MAG: metal ABC transporter ATP-binding protein [Gemmataceae bacterium]|nr:metal ABC transporter ATP-binding protein [Gemmataceae bacterium]
MTTSALVSVRDLHVELGGNPVLRGLNAELPRGQITAVLGLNGSGKTTLLRAILREIPYRGEITFHCGHDHRHPDPRHVGYVPQKLTIDSSMPLTVRDLLGLAMQRRPIFFGFSRKVHATKAEMLHAVGADIRLLDRPLEKISGGERQRVLLALALQPEPELLLLDEPASGIDVSGQEQFYDLISRLNREKGTTILLVSHDLSMVGKHVHRVICVKDGQVHCQAAPNEITPNMLQQVFGVNFGMFVHDHQHSHTDG